MAAQKGKDLLLKLDHDGDGGFSTVAGLRSKQLSFNAQTVDITHADSADRWRELLAGAGVRSASLSGSGLFKDASSDQSIKDIFFAGAIRNWQVIIPDFGTIEGAFQITALEFAGNHDGEVTFELALESAGIISFQALN
ncbi:MAG: phage major tail protein, TP901-1 family [Pseudomonadota bacterium]